MLLSRSHKFIFIHIYKNAGTSIRNALMPFTGSKYQLLHRALKKMHLPSPFFDPQPFNDHITASEIIQKMGYDQFKTNFSFAIVRNPWDWQVSLYNYMIQRPQHFQHDLVKGMGSFAAYIKWRCEREVRFQKDFICSNNGELLVDFVGRFERLEKDFQIICSKIGIETTLPKLNISNQRKPYQAYYNDETRNLVEKTFAADVTLFGYQF